MGRANPRGAMRNLWAVRTPWAVRIPWAVGTPVGRVVQVVRRAGPHGCRGAAGPATTPCLGAATGSAPLPVVRC